MKLASGKYFGDSLIQRRSKIVCLTLTRYEPDQHIAPHAHENPGFFLLLSGAHREINDRRVLNQSEASLIFHGHDAPHETVIGASGMVGLNISIDREWLEQLHMPRLRDKDGWVLEKPLAKTLAIRLLGAAFGMDCCVECALIETLALMAACEGKQEPLPPNWLRNVRLKLEAQFAFRHSLTELAEEAAVHPVYLARAFRRAYRCSIVEYLSNLRTFAAMGMIFRGMKVGDAAAECGFCDQAYLARVFKSRLGVAATQMIGSDCSRIAQA